MPLSANDIKNAFAALSADLASRDERAQIAITGGAALVLLFNARETTKDVDAYFATNAQEIREAARVIAERENLPPDWLNDGMKGFFYTVPPTTLWIEYPGLRVYYADPDYVLAMKAAAGRPEDIPDIQALATHLGLTAARGADHQDVLGRNLVSQLGAELLSATAIAQGDRDCALGVVLPDDMLVLRGNDRLGSELAFEHFG